MKIIIELNKNDNWQDFVHGHEYHAALREIDRLCRNALKHGHPYMSIDHALQTIRDRIREELEDVPFEG